MEERGIFEESVLRRLDALEKRIRLPREDETWPSEAAAKDPFMTGDVPDVTPRNKDELVAEILGLKDAVAKIERGKESLLDEALKGIQSALTNLLRLLEDGE